MFLRLVELCSRPTARHDAQAIGQLGTQLRFDGGDVRGRDDEHGLVVAGTKDHGRDGGAGVFGVAEVEFQVVDLASVRAVGPASGWALARRIEPVTGRRANKPSPSADLSSYAEDE